ncbi:MAG: amidohydrolase family protein, partial [Gemmatimonadetes bacterium]|nr:amidohydrolase family protein [Gemmatimonadota bacterium]
REIPFEAPVDREINEAMRFQYSFPEGEARAWSYRWAHRTPSGVVFEALGDIWIVEDGVPRNLTGSPAHEASPVVDADRGLLYYASWTDAGWGQVHRRPLGGGPPSVVAERHSQYGSLALGPDGTLAFVRGKSHLADGGRLETEEEFELVTLGQDGTEEVVTDVTMTPNTQGRHPVDVRFGPEGRVYYTEFVADTLVLRRVESDGAHKTTLYRFPHGEQATLSPDLKWIAFREYHRSYITPFEWIGNPVVVSGLDGVGFAERVDRMDGSFLAWSDETTLSWPRGGMLYEKTVENMLADDNLTDQGPQPVATDIGITFPVATATTTLAFTNARVITMDPDRGVLEGATVIVEGNRISGVGADLDVPEGAQVFDATGHTIMPGMVDAHAHPDAAASPTLVVEQRLPGILAGLAHGVTTMVELYGTEEKDPWVLDMITSGKMDGPRLLSVGAPMYGLRGFRPKTYRPIASYEEAEEHVLYSRDQGIPVLKDYVNFTRSDRHQLATAAREHGLNLVAETAGNSQMNYTQIVDGLTGLEHSMGVTPLYQDVIELFRASDVGVTPTLLVVYNGPAGQSYFDQSRRVWEDEKLLRFSKEEWLRSFRRVTHFWEDDLYAPEMAAAMKELFDAGVLVNAGGHGQMLGRDMHWELELFVQGGFTPLEALQVATINGARYHGLGASLGSVEVGKLADLVVLTENPLEDIRNTQAIRYVIKAGLVYDGRDASRVFPDPREAPPFYFQRRP